MQDEEENRKLTAKKLVIQIKNFYYVLFGLLDSGMVELATAYGKPIPSFGKV